MPTGITRKESVFVFCLCIWEKLRQKVHLNPTGRAWEMRATAEKVYGYLA